MTPATAQLAISAGFRAFRMLEKDEQAAVLETLDFFRRTQPLKTKNWPAEMLADRLIREDAKRGGK